MTPFQAWLEAARLRTLAAAFIPVAIGTALAWSQASVNWAAAFTALICAFLIQIGTNFANDYYDHINGTDNDDRVGFTRATSSGAISPKAMKYATFGTMALAFFIGLYLVYLTDWQILVLGIASLVFGILYTGGPFPLGYNGLGDLFVFLFFGIGAVMGSYYIHTLEWSQLAFWASLPAGALSVNILVVNNLRDIKSDAETEKRTLGVIFGEKFLKLEYTIMILVALAIPPHLWFWEDFSMWIFLPYISIPFTIPLLQSVFTESVKSNLNQTLTNTAKHMTIFGILFAIGIIAG